MKTYVITGGTGKTGKPLSLKLLESGNRVRVICRDAKRADGLKKKGADIFTGDTRDEAFLKNTFNGADALYVLLPIDVQAADYTAMQVAHATAIRNAVVATGINYAVTLSSVGADLDEGNGVVLGLHKMEQLFNEVPGLNVTHVRATYFMENTLGQIRSIKEHGLMAAPVDGNIKFAMVASGDIADVVFGRLSKLNFSGKNISYVLGQRDVSYNEIAAVYGNALGNPGVKYIRMTDEKFRSVMSEAGMGASAVEKFLEFNHLINSRSIHNLYNRTAANTSPTSIEQFADKIRGLVENDQL